MNLENLLIYRPQSQSAAQRWTSTAFTTIAWAMLFYGFFPIAGFFVGRQLLPALPFERNVTSMGAWGSLVPLLPWWALAVLLMVGTLYIWATVQFIRFRHSRRNGNTELVSTAEMAAHCMHPEKSVADWGAARRAVAHYDDNATMVAVGTALDEPFREIPRDDEPPAPTSPLAKPNSARVCGEQREREMEGRATRLRKELVDYWGRVESMEALMRDVAENRKLRYNNRDVVLYAQLKETRIALIARIKAHRQELATMRFLLEESGEVLTAFKAGREANVANFANREAAVAGLEATDVAPVVVTAPAEPEAGLEKDAGMEIAAPAVLEVVADQPVEGAKDVPKIAAPAYEYVAEFVDGLIL